jgi:small subunit ribosomal protein S1
MKTQPEEEVVSTTENSVPEEVVSTTENPVPETPPEENAPVAKKPEDAPPVEPAPPSDAPAAVVDAAGQTSDEPLKPEPNGAEAAEESVESAGTEKLAELLDDPAEKARGTATPKKGSRVRGTVVRIADEGVFIDFGGREEGVLDPREIQDENGAATKEVGAKIQATVVGVEGGIKLSLKAKAGRKPGNVPALLEASKNSLTVSGKVVGVNKGGLVVYVMGVRAFCPFSQIDRRYVDSPESFIGRKLPFKVASMDEKGKNVVLSRRVLLEEEAKEEASKLRETLAVGMELTGTVARVRPFGAFVDLGGLDGLVHVSEISHRRVKDPGEILKPGQSVKVQVVKIDDLGGQSERISLSMKRFEADPWDELTSRISEGDKIHGKVVRLVDFGAFVEISAGVDGLAHVSTLAEGRVEHPSDVVSKGDEVDAWIVSIDPASRRISLSLVDPAELPSRSGGKSPRNREPRPPREPREEIRSAGAPGMTSMEEAFQRLREQQETE